MSSGLVSEIQGVKVDIFVKKIACINPKKPPMCLKYMNDPP